MVVINGIDKTITVTIQTSVDVRKDIYSAWKNWCIIGNNLKYKQAMRPVGGDAIGGGNTSPNFFFLMNNWKVVVDGVVVTFQFNLYCEEATNTNTVPFLYINDGHSNNEVSSSPVVTGDAGSATDETTIHSALDSYANKEDFQADVAELSETVDDIHELITADSCTSNDIHPGRIYTV